MKIAIIGCGYVGLVSGVCLAALEHQVTCYDTDHSKIAALRAGHIPIYEPGLEEFVKLHAARLNFSTELNETLNGSEVVFLCVGTPTIKTSGEADLRYVFEAVAQLGPLLAPSTLLVTKSTVPIGTNRRIAEQLEGIVVASNPEFLREGSAVHDFMHPDRIVIGCNENVAAERLKEVYRHFDQRKIPFVFSSWETAEMIKYAANTFLAAKVAFINEMADLCEVVGADIDVVSHGIGLDPRINPHFLKAGPGFGGSCFPKDTKALLKIAEAKQLSLPITEAVVTSNEKRPHTMVEKILTALGGTVEGKTVAILGLTFKPGTNDVRESVALVIIPELLARGARIQAYDPAGMSEFKKALPDTMVHYRESALACLMQADGAVLLTEWPEFCALSLSEIASALKTPVLLDLRNMFDAQEVQRANIAYTAIGKAKT